MMEFIDWVPQDLSGLPVLTPLRRLLSSSGASRPPRLTSSLFPFSLCNFTSRVASFTVRCNVCLACVVRGARPNSSSKILFKNFTSCNVWPGCGPLASAALPLAPGLRHRPVAPEPGSRKGAAHSCSWRASLSNLPCRKQRFKRLSSRFWMKGSRGFPRSRIHFDVTPRHAVVMPTFVLLRTLSTPTADQRAPALGRLDCLLLLIASPTNSPLVAVAGIVVGTP